MFPETVDVYRFDYDSRVKNGIKTARTLLAEAIGTEATFQFLEEDVQAHLRSSYDSRLESPSVSNAGIGSPFISGAFHTPGCMFPVLERLGVLEKVSLHKLSVDRGRVIVPIFQKLSGIENWQKYASEVLIVGDVDPDSIQRVGSAAEVMHPTRKKQVSREFPKPLPHFPDPFEKLDQNIEVDSLVAALIRAQSLKPPFPVKKPEYKL